jgi:RES domain-containing protein
MNIVSAWRIAVETRDFAADDLSGGGAKVTGGRWNRTGSAMVYASSSIALACLETVVHLSATGLPLNRYVVRLDIPSDLWKAAVVVDPVRLVGWDAEPYGVTSQRYGEAWLRGGASALLRVPSVVVPEEFNVLINPLHPDRRRIAAVKLRRFLYDPRLR